jgi:5-methylcytosine-specific restriction endonuclease McrA
MESALTQKVLVLNSGYEVVRTITVRRALTLLLKSAAEVIHVDENDKFCTYDFKSWKDMSEFKAEFDKTENRWLKCVKYELLLPQVIRLTKYNKYFKPTLKFNRHNIFIRDGNKCQYCGKKFKMAELTIDHIVPRIRGGKANWLNIVCACFKCNVKKGGRTPIEAGMALIKQPIEPKGNVTFGVDVAKYASWKHFVDRAYWQTELEE